MDSRPVANGENIRRRRRCTACERRFTTREIVIEDGARTVPVRADKLEALAAAAFGLAGMARRMKGVEAVVPGLAEAAE